MNHHTRTSLSTAVFLVATFMLGMAAPADAQEAVPDFDKAFSPDIIGPGSVSMLTFTIDNTASGLPADELAFTDLLPAGTSLAAPAFASNTCFGTVTAPDGGDTITLTDGMVGAGLTCEIMVNVTAEDTEGNPYTNLSGDLTSTLGNSGTASDDLEVSDALPGFSKSFAPSSVALGSRSTLTFTIDNSANGLSAYNVNFTDNLPAGMLVADPANAATDCENPAIPATLTAVPGSSSITLVAFGSLQSPVLGAEATCTVVVDVVAGATGELGNVSEELLVTIGSTEFSSGKAAAVLEVTGADNLLGLTKEFTDDPVPPGGTVNLEFTVTNRSRDFPATAITFEDIIDPMGTSPVLTGLAPSGALPIDPCGAGSALTFGSGFLTLTGGTLAPDGSCTISVPLLVPAATAPGAYTNTTEASFSGLIDGNTESGNIANDLLFVVDSPILTKEFTDDPVGAGGTATLSFTIRNVKTDSGLTALEFTDDLNTAIPGLAANSLVDGMTDDPIPDVCGPGSQLTVFNPPDIVIGQTTIITPPDPTLLVFTGGSLAAAGTPGDSCTFEVAIDVPVIAPSGVYTNTSGEISGEFDGPDPTTGPPASGDLIVIGAPELAKEFTDDPVAPGGTVTLEFSLENLDLNNAASAIAFGDDLGETLTGLILDSVLTNTCGGTVAGVGTDLFGYSGGSLAAEGSCTIAVALQVPGGPSSPGGIFENTTSEVTATVAGLTAGSRAASDNLVVTGLTFTKAFAPDSTIAGSDVTLTFTLDNTAGTGDASAITFRDPIDPLTVVSGAPASPCGGSLTVVDPSGPAVTALDFSGGSVTAGNVCSFDVTLNVPLGTPNDIYGNATENEFAIVDATFVDLPPATDTLAVNSALLVLTKDFTDDPVLPGGTATLEFTIENLSSSETVTDIMFSDDLYAALSGLEATGALSNDCGGMAAGFPAPVFEYAGGSLGPGASCTIVLSVSVPIAPLASAPPYINSTTPLTGKVGALDVFGDPASDELIVRNVTFTKEFTDDPAEPGDTANLRFTITNVGTSALNGLAFSDNLDDVLPGLVATGLPATPCGPGSVVAGTTFLTVTGASLAPAGSAGDSCSFDVTVTVPLASEVCGTVTNITSPLSELGFPVANPATALFDLFAETGSGAFLQAGGLLSVETENVPTLSAEGWQIIDGQNATEVSNGAFIKAVPGPENSIVRALGPPDTALVYPVTLDAGTQYVWFRARVTDIVSNSIFFQLDDGALINVNLLYDFGQWAWVQMPQTITVGPPDGGPHTITIYRREGLTEVDKFVVTDNAAYVPTELGPDESEREPTSTCTDTDGDGIPDVIDDDDDGDGMSDEFERENGFDPLDPDDANEDEDGDGATNLEEANQGTDPNDPDTDGDGIDDSVDPDPNTPSNNCTRGTADYGVMDEAVSSELTCAARVAIDVLSPNTVVTPPDGDLTLIAPSVKFRNGFSAGDLTVINEDPCPLCNNSVAPEVIAIDPPDGAFDVAVASGIDITFSEPVTLAPEWATVVCNGTTFNTSAPSDVLTMAVSDNDPSFTLDPPGELPKATTCNVTVTAANVTDDDSIDPPDNMAADFTSSFTTVPPLDFGDAPDPTYPTLLANDGARHILGSGSYLGLAVDEESDGQPSGFADGDDFAGVDDEDGVTFTSTLTPGGTATVDVVATGTGGAYYLNAWVDFNADGDWDDTGEQIFTDRSLILGTNALSFSVPAGATVGDPYARFRLDSNGGLSPTGEAADGEVEDYQVAIVANNSPTDIDLSNTDVDENQPSGTAIGTFSTTDADSAGPFTYTLVAGTGDTDNASFGIVGDQLQTAAIFDFETQSSYSIRVQTDDGAGGLYEEVFTITVNDLNDAPTDIALDSSNVDENQPAGTAVGTLSTTDVDSAAFTYTLVAGTGDTDNASFGISGDQLQTAAIFDFETQNSYSIRVQTDDGSGGLYEEAFTITVNDLNDAPTDIALDSSNVDENQPAGTAVGTLSTTDVDSAAFTYTLVAGAGDTDNASFGIVGDQLQTAAMFDFETQNSYSIRVQTDDGAGGLYEEVFTITVNNVNENPVITSDGGGVTASVNAAENQTAVTTVTATDIDFPAQTLTFVISGGADLSLFNIVGATGALTFNSAPDFENPTDSGGNNVYDVQVTVTDNGSPNLSDVQDITITVTNVLEAHTHDGGEIVSPTLLSARVDAAIAEDTEIVPIVLANDGAGSGIDADLIDGRDATDLSLRLSNHLTVSPSCPASAAEALAARCWQTVSAALAEIGAGLPVASSTTRYFVRVGPGTYNEQVTMKPFVNIEGSGQKVTAITNSSSPTVAGANDAVLSSLTVENTGNGIAIQNTSVSPKIEQVTARASGGGSAIGVVNQTSAAPMLTRLTTVSTGFGVLNNLATATIRNSVLGSVSIGIQNATSTASIVNTQITGSASDGGTGATFNCVGAYDATFTELDGNCQ